MNRKRLRPIMFVGTCSDAGKSVVNTAFCRIFKQDGYSPAPFKAQNMSLNSYSTKEGEEIGRAQAVQAEACGLEPQADMNPVLLKPTNERSSQVVLNGRPIGNMSAGDYFRDDKMTLFKEAAAAFRRLEAKYNPIVLEGAGSISELNLRDRDITNMRMALQADAATFLVADIDRGGVFASVYGSIQLLPPEEKALMKGIIINKFRGDITLFGEGRRMLEELTGVPVVGVIPYYNDIHIEEEDSVALETKNNKAAEGKINVAIVLLKRLSNFTDFDVLGRDKRFNAYFTNNAEEIEKADIIILPGSKNTIADMQYLRAEGVAETIIREYKKGKKIIGICGGYQMMGVRIEDPEGVEGDIRAVPGLGLLPVMTVMENEKVTCQSSFRFKNTDTLCSGYQIHMGKTLPVEDVLNAGGKKADSGVLPLNRVKNGGTDGCWLNDRCWGSYMHGIFDNTVVLNDLAAGFDAEGKEDFDYAAFKERQYDLLAGHVRTAVDMEYIYSVMEN